MWLCILSSIAFHTDDTICGEQVAGSLSCFKFSLFFFFQPVAAAACIAVMIINVLCLGVAIVERLCPRLWMKPLLTVVNLGYMSGGKLKWKELIDIMSSFVFFANFFRSTLYDDLSNH
ncbi:hypothetical protein Ancab_026395 [Ancistrocladus abbreviatus]